jgi:nicotinamide riboside transporter PnuC
VYEGGEMNLDLFLQITWPLLGVMGTILIALKNKWGWFCYCYANIAAIIVLLGVHKYLPVSQYAVYMVINVIGIIKWFKNPDDKSKEGVVEE